MPIELILVRHAHRNKDEGFDNGLSERGKREAIALARVLVNSIGASATLYSSPKRRCRETLRPVSRTLKQKVIVDPRLDEQGATEALDRFEERLRLFVRDIKTAGRGRSIVCSHGDWIPRAIEMIAGLRMELKKGGFAQLILSPTPKLISLVQDILSEQVSHKLLPTK